MLVCYHFSTFYISSIQQGIQAAHAQTEMALKVYEGSCSNRAATEWLEWSKNHKTMICLNGGGVGNLHTICDTLSNTDLAWACFYESEEDLGGILTNVCFVANEDITNLIKFRREHRKSVWSSDSSHPVLRDHKGYTLVDNNTPSRKTSCNGLVKTIEEANVIDAVASAGLAR